MKTRVQVAIFQGTYKSLEVVMNNKLHQLSMDNTAIIDIKVTRANDSYVLGVITYTEKLAEADPEILRLVRDVQNFDEEADDGEYREAA